MTKYTRRRLFGIWRNRQISMSNEQISTDPILTEQVSTEQVSKEEEEEQAQPSQNNQLPANQETRQSSRPQPPSIHPQLPQQLKPAAHSHSDPSPFNQTAIAQPANSSSQPIPQFGMRQVVFSFDDGPSTLATAKVLDILAKYQIQAIFFVLGSKIATKAGRNLMVRAHQEGHMIANHTYSHPNLTQISAEDIRDELRRTEDLIGDYAAPGKLMRPPYGSLNKTVREVLDQEGYTAVLWTTATLDWQYQNDQWVGYAVEKIQNGPLHNHILMHDTYRWTANNLEAFIQQIQRMPNTRIAPFYG